MNDCSLGASVVAPRLRIAAAPDNEARFPFEQLAPQTICRLNGQLPRHQPRPARMDPIAAALLNIHSRSPRPQDSPGWDPEARVPSTQWPSTPSPGPSMRAETSERRRHPRRESRHKVILLATDPPRATAGLEWRFLNDAVPGRLINVSLRGLAIESNEPMEPGVDVLIRIPASTGSKPSELGGRVLRCQSQEQGVHRTIVRLSFPLTVAQAEDISLKLGAHQLV